jgi:hypothetical protein
MAKIGLICFDIVLVTEDGDECKTTVHLNVVPGFDKEDEEEKKKVE